MSIINWDEGHAHRHPSLAWILVPSPLIPYSMSPASTSGPITCVCWICTFRQPQTQQRIWDWVWSACMGWEQAYSNQEDDNNKQGSNDDGERDGEALKMKQHHCRGCGRDMVVEGCGVEGTGGWKLAMMSLDFRGNGNTNSKWDWIINVVARQSRRSCVRVVRGTSMQ